MAACARCEGETRHSRAGVADGSLARVRSGRARREDTRRDEGELRARLDELSASRARLAPAGQEFASSWLFVDVPLVIFCVSMPRSPTKMQ